jgi:hypothetical protein
MKPFEYSRDFTQINFRKHPELYQVGRGERRMSDAGVIDGFADLRSRLADTAVHTLRACNLGADEQLLILTDSATAPSLTQAFTDAATVSGHSGDVVLLNVRPRRPAFADLPPLAVDALLAADLVIDLTTVPWLYSDSFTRYGQDCQARGSRLALVWGMPESLRTLAACPPSATLANRARRALPRLNDARTVRVRSTTGTDFHAELGDPLDYRRSFIGEPPTSPGMIGAPLCASVTAPFVPGTAQGTLEFVGAGRFQGPENSPIRSEWPVTLTVEAGRVANVQGKHAAGIALADWFARAHHDDVFVVMDCNIGFDPRADLAWADNTVVHSFAGGIMIGIGSPYQYRSEGSHRPGYHLDLMFPGVDVDLDETPFIQAGAFVPDVGIG